MTTLGLELDVALMPGKARGRTVKFTPERMDQIRNLVERGQTREEIAAIIGCTLGSLQVTCSRVGISLRKPRLGYQLAPRQVMATVVDPPSGGNGDDKADHGNGDGNGRKLSPADFVPQPKTAAYALRVTYGTKVYDIPIPIAPDTMAALAVTADVRGMRLSELIAEILTKGVEE